MAADTRGILSEGLDKVHGLPMRLKIEFAVLLVLWIAGLVAAVMRG